MFYDFSLTIPANTPQSSPQRQRIKLTQGVIHKVEIQFPSGCAGLVHVLIRDLEQQVWPTNRDGSFASDNYVISFIEFYELKEPPYEFELEGWNEDDTFDHTITFRFGVLPREALEPYREQMSFLERFRRLVGL